MRRRDWTPFTILLLCSIHVYALRAVIDKPEPPPEPPETPKADIRITLDAELPPMPCYGQPCRMIINRDGTVSFVEQEEEKEREQ